MPSSTQLRQFLKSMDLGQIAFWICDDTAEILFASAAVGELLGCDARQLIGQKAEAGRAADQDFVRASAARLAPPPGIHRCGVLCVDLPSRDTSPSAKVVFVRSGETRPVIFGIGVPLSFRDHADHEGDAETAGAIELRKTLTVWRQQERNRSAACLAGRSLAIRRLRNQVRIASQIREDLLILAPNGFPAEVIASQLHEASLEINAAKGLNHADEDPAEIIDGPLMDMELLEAVCSPLIGHLTSDDEPPATAIIRGFHEMPLEAQARLAQWKSVFGHRLRLIALAATNAIHPPGSSSPSSDGSQSSNGPNVTCYSGSPRLDQAAWLHPELRETLGALVLEVPALADRVDDISLVASALLDHHRLQHTATADRISRDAMDALIRYPWPDDVGELDESIRHALRVCSHDSVAREHLPLVVRTYRPEPTEPECETMDLDQTLRSIELRLIEEALQATDGNRAEAARRLGISRARLLRRLDDAESDSSARLEP